MLPLFDPMAAATIGLDVLGASRLQPADIASRAATRLATLLRHAKAESVFYQQRLAGIDPDKAPLASLPVVTKPELMAHFGDWVTDPLLKLDELRSFVANPSLIGQSYLDQYLVWESSGTSGLSAIFVQDARSMAVLDALEALRRNTPRPWQRLFDPLQLTERFAFVGATTGHFASQVSVERLRRLNPLMAATTRSFSILMPGAELIEQLNEFQPTVLATYPSAAAMLADESRRGHLKLRPREVWTGGETLSEQVRRHVIDTFGCAVRNSYGASEFLSIGWECGQGALHVNADWVTLEPVDDRYQPVPPGELSHTTLLTNLANRIQPIIRYDLGDRIRMLPGRCRCGSPLPAIEIAGRDDDLLVMGGRNGATVTLLPLALSTVMEDEAGVFDFCLQQRDQHTLALRLGGLLGADFGAAAGRCRHALQAYALAQGMEQLHILEEPGLAIPLGHSGKAKRVIAQPQPR